MLLTPVPMGGTQPVAENLPQQPDLARDAFDLFACQLFISDYALSGSCQTNNTAEPTAAIKALQLAMGDRLHDIGTPHGPIDWIAWLMAMTHARVVPKPAIVLCCYALSVVGQLLHVCLRVIWCGPM